MSETIGRGKIVLEINAEEVNAKVADVKTTVKDLGYETERANLRAKKSIDAYVKSLDLQQSSLGKTATEMKLMQLAARGASEDQLKAAAKSLLTIEKYNEAVAKQAEDEKLRIKEQADLQAAKARATEEAQRRLTQIAKDNARAFEEADQRLRDNIDSAVTTVRNGVLLAVTAAAGLGAAIDRLIGKAAKFQDLAEQVGDSAEAVASLSVSADVAGVSMDEVASASAKLTKALTSVDDDSKAANAALKAIGINLESFKNLSAVDQLEAVGKALNKYADSQEKVQVAQALFGKSGAQFLTFLKELGQEGGRQVILNQKQIEQADAFKDAQAKLGAQLSLNASQIATQLLPRLNDLSVSLAELAKDQDFAREASELLNGALEAGLIVFQTLAVVGSDVAFVFRGVKNELAGWAEQLKALARGDFDGFRQIGDEMTASAQRARAELDKFQNQVMSIGKNPYKVEIEVTSAAGQTFNVNPEIEKAAKQFEEEERRRSRINFRLPDSKAASEAAAEAKAQLDREIDAIRLAGAQRADAYSDAEKILASIRSAGLAEDRAYFTEKRRLLNAQADAEIAALTLEKLRLEQEKLSGKEKLENLRKIEEVQAKLDKVARDRSTANVQLTIEESTKIRQLEQAWRTAEDAATDYLESIRRTQRAELALAGRGNRERERITGRLQIERKYDEERIRLERSRRDAEANGTFGADSQKRYDEEIDRIRRFREQALGEYDVYYQRRLAQDTNWENGASRAIENYADTARNVAAQTENLFANAFGGMEDALVDFVMTGKLSFTDFANSLVADITRIIVKQVLLNQLTAAAGSAGGGGFGGMLASIGTSLLGSALGGGTTGGTTASSGMGNLASLLNGRRAMGGPVSAGGLYEVNEKGPELLTVAGRQYLMMGDQAGKVTPNDALSGGSTVNVTINQQFAPGTSRATTLQAAADARRQLAYAGRNL